MTHNSDDGHSAAKPATRLVHLGRDKTITGQFVNPPVVHASTVLFDSVDDMQHRRQRYSYGRQRHADQRGARKRRSPKSKAPPARAVSVRARRGDGRPALVPVGRRPPSGGRQRLRPGAPLRGRYAAARLGIETVFYDPSIGADIETLFNENTTAVYAEAPGSLTFEMQDLAAIAAGRQKTRRHRAVRQHLGDAAVLPAARARRRSLHPGRHQIYRRPLRPDARHRRGQRRPLCRS